MISTLSHRLAWTLVATRSSLIQQSSTAVAVADTTSTMTLSSRDGVKRGSESIRVRRTMSGGRWGGAVALATSWGEIETMLLYATHFLVSEGSSSIIRGYLESRTTLQLYVPSHT